MYQVAFPFLQEMDDKRDGIARVDGQPILNQPRMSGWIHRCWYPHAEDALKDARRASELVPGMKFYVVQFSSVRGDGYIDRSIWPEGRYWSIMEQPPFSGVVGDDYYPRRDYYIVLRGTEFLVEGEDVEVIARKRRKAREEWRSKVEQVREYCKV